MKPRRSLIKLLIGSIIAGIIIKYAAQIAGPDTDPVPLIGQFFQDLIVNQTLTRIPYNFFNVNTLLWLIIFLLIALVPFMFALFSGIWGFLTYLSGFLGGYLLVSGYLFTPDFLTLIAGIFCVVLGIMAALYGDFIKT
ncbi:MAG TPA: hypothetical protein VMS81_02145 [Methanomicrobiales archaeon]|jgi:hypothetical protein|nr:hypothetical protein [Methanomicrobiales archaeon]